MPNPNPQLLVLVGLPASGKSTYARSLRTHYRVNKDNLRLANPGANEREIHRLQMDYMLTCAALREHIVLDNTNLNPSTRNQYRAWAERMDYSYAEKWFTGISIHELYMRDAERENRVGRDVIYEMALRWQQIDAGDTVVFDIDGTLALTDVERLECLKQEPKDWKGFFAGQHRDKLNVPVAALWHALMAGDRHNLICCSGRPVEYRTETRAWLKVHGIDPTVILMRRTGDRRPDDIVKREIYNDYLCNTAQVEFVVDDRAAVVKMWRSLGLTCFQVAEGDF